MKALLMIFVGELDSVIGGQEEQEPEPVNHVPNPNPLAVDLVGYPNLKLPVGDSQMTDEQVPNQGIEDPELSKKNSFDPDKIAGEDVIEQ